MAERKFISSNEAVAYGVKLARAEVVAAYPITPQTSIVEALARFIANGQMRAEFIKVESEHSAMTACLGACAAGSRAFTASSSQGLEYMHEMLAYVSGGRFPLVMVAVNRSTALPWSIWGDQQDTIQQRDTGWMQVYVESAQEALDMVLQAYRIAEDYRVLCPVMVCCDGFILSHAEEVVEIPDQALADEFLPRFRPYVSLDVDNPKTLAVGGFGPVYAGWKRQQQEAMMGARRVILEVADGFAAVFDRHHDGMVAPYRCEDAEAAIVCMGGISGTVREVVDEMRDEGRKVGFLRVRFFRPFPQEDVRTALAGASAIAVIDRDCSYGFQGALCSDLKAALYGVSNAPVINFIAGLGGSDVRPEDIREMLEKTLAAASTGKAEKEIEFVGAAE